MSMDYGVLVVLFFILGLIFCSYIIYCIIVGGKEVKEVFKEVRSDIKEPMIFLILIIVILYVVQLFNMRMWMVYVVILVFSLIYNFIRKKSFKSNILKFFEGIALLCLLLILYTFIFRILIFFNISETTSAFITPLVSLSILFLILLMVDYINTKK